MFDAGRGTMTQVEYHITERCRKCSKTYITTSTDSACPCCGYDEQLALAGEPEVIKDRSRSPRPVGRNWPIAFIGSLLLVAGMATWAVAGTQLVRHSYSALYHHWRASGDMALASLASPLGLAAMGLICYLLSTNFFLASRPPQTDRKAPWHGLKPGSFSAPDGGTQRYEADL